jgi:hypothetical protein
MLTRSPAASLLRRIALGLPLAPILAGAPLLATTAACYCGSDCGQPRTREIALTAEQTNRVIAADGTVDFDACALLCDELAPELSGFYAGMVDDAGVYTGRVTACTVVGVGSGTMTCTAQPLCIGGRRPAGLADGHGCRSHGGGLTAALRAIALGVPLAPFLGACVGSLPPCPGPRTDTFELSAEETSRIVDADGNVDFAECARVCEERAFITFGMGTVSDGGTYSGPVSECSVVGVGTATMTCTYRPLCRGGRRPAGLVEAAPRSTPAVGRWLAQAAHLETASVPAFVELAAELAAHGAPAALVRASLRAADDERRHARTVARLARARGAAPPPVVREPTEPRDLSSLLLDDVVEGCVHETFAALVAAHQAAAAEAPDVRSAYATIARDEARHALLSFAIADWAGARVARTAARRAEDARQEAISSLARAAEIEPTELGGLGLPEATRAVDLAMLFA